MRKCLEKPVKNARGPLDFKLLMAQSRKLEYGDFPLASGFVDIMVEQTFIYGILQTEAKNPETRPAPEKFKSISRIHVSVRFI